MTYTLTFSHIVEGKRVPLHIEGREAIKIIEADSKTGAIHHEDTKAFCNEHNATVRTVT